VRVPAEVPPGKVQITIDFSSWPALTNPIATGEVTIRTLPVVPVEEAVSPRFLKSLQHPDRSSSFSLIHFSSDGKRLCAGGYPGGNVVVYDVASSSRLTQIDAGKCRVSGNFLKVLPDEQSMLTFKQRQDKIEFFDKDKQPMGRLVGSPGIKRWNLKTGELVWTDSRTNPGGLLNLSLSPTSNVFVIEEYASGDFVRGTRIQRRTLFGDANTGKLQLLPSGLSGYGLFSTDGKAFVTFNQSEEDYVCAIKVLDGERFQEIASWPIDESHCYCEILKVTPKHQVIYKLTSLPSKRDIKQLTSRLMMLDYSLPNSPPQVLIPNSTHCFNFLFSRDMSKLLFVSKNESQYELKQLELMNSANVRSTTLPSASDRFYGTSCALSHQGKYLALAQWAEIPKELLSEDEIKPEQIGQPRIILIEVATGKVVDTLVSPHAFLGGFAFSPDDKTLASSGRGCIHLWDISHLK